jgi:hypothetical protein
VVGLITEKKQKNLAERLFKQVDSSGGQLLKQYESWLSEVVFYILEKRGISSSEIKKRVDALYKAILIILLNAFEDIFDEMETVFDFEIEDKEEIINRKVGGLGLKQRVFKSREDLKNKLNAALVKQELMEDIPARTLRILLNDLKELTGMNFNKPFLILATESHRMINEVKLEFAEEYSKRTGKRLVKKWYTMRDNAVRDTHKKLNGAIVGLNELFETDGDSAIAPGLFSSPANNINCRCFIVLLEEN